MLKIKTYADVTWHNYWDPSVDENWVLNYLIEYKDTWPNIREEIIPIAKPDQVVSSFQLRSLTYAQIDKVDSISGMEKMKTICAYGITGWAGLENEDRTELKPAFTKDGLGEKLVPSSVEILSFFGFTDLPITSILAVQIMSLSRSSK